MNKGWKIFGALFFFFFPPKKCPFWPILGALLIFQIRPGFFLRLRFFLSQYSLVTHNFAKKMFKNPPNSYTRFISMKRLLEKFLITVNRKNLNNHFQPKECLKKNWGRMYSGLPKIPYFHRSLASFQISLPYIFQFNSSYYSSNFCLSQFIISTSPIV